MVRARKLGVLTAVLYAVDLQEASISMERVDGSTVKALLHSSTLQGAGAPLYMCYRSMWVQNPCNLVVLLSMPAHCEVTMTSHHSSCCAELQAVLTQIGEALAVLHDGGLVHGDLTTSNLMVRSRDAALVRAARCSGSVTVACKHCQREYGQEWIHQTVTRYDAVIRSCWILDSAPRHRCPRTRVWTCMCWSAPSRALTRQTAIAWLVDACSVAVCKQVHDLLTLFGQAVRLICMLLCACSLR